MRIGWRDVSPHVVDAKGYGIAVTEVGSVLLGTNDGVYRSNDRGMTWALRDEGLASRTVYGFAGDHDIYAGTAAGVQRSVDDGLTWER